uniref:Uncharacterized protein n=1 Tax=Grammatophora oceanica TaxID=210454 RepID=A0A7S1UYE8_9STRA
MIASSSSLLASSWMNERRDPYEKVDNQSSGGSMDFSQLMHQAEDRNTIAKSTKQLPTLTEEEEVRPSDTFGDTLHSSSPVARALDQSWLPEASTSTPISKVREIQVEVQSEFSFRMSMEFDSNCSMRDVMSVIGNPDLLRLWNESVASLVVTRSSEGAHCGLNRYERHDQDRQYDGEWIEASASLNSPVNGIGMLHSVSNYMWHFVGFPSMSKVSMFVERERGNVGLTIGPFDGGLSAFHTMSVSEYQGAVRLVDAVKLSWDGSEERSSAPVNCCGLWSAVQRCMLRPQVQQQMDQSMSSLHNLRLMVENGEHRKYDDVGGLTIVGANDDQDPAQPLLIT